MFQFILHSPTFCPLKLQKCVQTSPCAYCTFRQRPLLLDREKAECYNETVTGNEKESTARGTAKRVPDGASGMRRARRKMALELCTEPRRMR